MTSLVNKYPPYPSTFAKKGGRKYNTYSGKVNIDRNTDTKAGIFIKFLQSISINNKVVRENSNKDSED